MAEMDILYFAWVREAIGKDGELVADPDPDMTITGLLEQLQGKGEGYTRAFADLSRIRAALDHAFVPLDTPLGKARELALFPPVTGG